MSNDIGWGPAMSVVYVRLCTSVLYIKNLHIEPFNHQSSTLARLMSLFIVNIKILHLFIWRFYCISDLFGYLRSWYSILSSRTNSSCGPIHSNQFWRVCYNCSILRIAPVRFFQLPKTSQSKDWNWRNGIVCRC